MSTNLISSVDPTVKVSVQFDGDSLLDNSLVFMVSSALPLLKCVRIMNGAGQIDLSLIPPAQVLEYRAGA